MTHFLSVFTCVFLNKWYVTGLVPTCTVQYPLEFCLLKYRFTTTFMKLDRGYYRSLYIWITSLCDGMICSCPFENGGGQDFKYTIYIKISSGPDWSKMQYPICKYPIWDKFYNTYIWVCHSTMRLPFKNCEDVCKVMLYKEMHSCRPHLRKSIHPSSGSHAQLPWRNSGRNFLRICAHVAVRISW